MRAEAKAAKWRPVADQLRARPGQWAVIAEGAIRDQNQLLGYIRSGSGPFAPRGSFEASQRTDPDTVSLHGRTGKVYARYVGETPPP
jgi:hypothetical protein